MMRTPVCVIGAALTMACGGGSGDGMVTPAPPPPLPAAVTVTTMANGPDGDGQTFRFSPASVKVARGGTITWLINPAASVEHTVTSNGDAWTPSGNLGAGQSFSVTFPTAGAFPYRCTIHPEMTGQITVEG